MPKNYPEDLRDLDEHGAHPEESAVGRRQNAGPGLFIPEWLPGSAPVWAKSSL